MTQAVKILKLLQCDQNLLNGQRSETEKSQSCLEVVVKFQQWLLFFDTVLTKHFCPVFAKSSNTFP